MEKIELVIKRIRWKSIFYEQGTKNYGLKSLDCLPKIKEMTNFENDLTNKKFFPVAVNGRCKNYKEHEDNFNICR